MSAHYFIAIHLPETLQDYFSKWQHTLKQELPYKQWSHKQDLHITLKFLGPVADNKLTVLQNKLKEIGKYDPFSLAIRDFGTFGNPKKPRVLWAGLGKTESLVQLQAAVEKICSAAGFEKEKRAYCPHITLAKKWNGSEIKNLDQKLRNKKLDKQEWHVEDIVLFRIHPRESPKYEAVCKYPLQGGEGTGSAY
jgi:2'-5' RNA ligase